mmetsp:Transcript_19541/g.48812  ORF Transcript_19541/g.48812 Transcript_19541/m.48812 type:complete len:252 (+) Transcript_19541:331-1086(+)
MMRRHSGLLLPPPTRRTSAQSAGTPRSCIARSPASSENVAPSSAARYSRPGRERCPARSPTSAPLACGQLGVRSPTRYGTKVRPSQPMGSASARAVISSRERPYAARTSSGTLAQLSVQRSGSPPPVASRKGQTAPVASRAARNAFANIVPLVPKLIATRPSVVHPQPSALIMLSPPPAETGMPGVSPSFAATSGSSTPARSVGPMRGGSLWMSCASIICAAASSHFLAVVSRSPVPLASPHSITSEPVRM